MFEVTLLHTRDKVKWLELLRGLDLKDPHYLPGYLQIYENESNRESFAHFGGEGMLFVYGDSRNFIVYPFFKRSLSNLPFYEHSAENLFDIISPYGYGGPLAQIEDKNISEELWSGFFKEFGAFCRQSNIVSEFTRLHPLFKNAIATSEFSDGCTEQKGRIIYVDLTLSEDNIVGQMSSKRRNGLRKATRNEALKCFATSGQEHAPLFAALYGKTMTRTGAEARFHFSSDFFKLAFNVLKDHITICYVVYGTKPVAAVLLLRNGDICYAWLACSDDEYFHLHPNELSFYQSALEAKRKGCKFLILGGGYSGVDSLFRFKAGFSGLFKDFHVYKKIHLENEYSELIKCRNRYDNGATGDFFPEYRNYKKTLSSNN